MLNTGKCQKAQIIPKIRVPLISPKGRSLGNKYPLQPYSSPKLSGSGRKTNPAVTKIDVRSGVAWVHSKWPMPVTSLNIIKASTKKKGTK